MIARLGCVLMLLALGLCGCVASTGTTASMSGPAAPGRIGECRGAQQTEMPDYHLQKVDQLPEVVARVPPEYPDMALQSRVDGTVALLVLICADGSVQDTRVARSVPMLDQAAIEAVRQWTYQPAILSGHAVAAWLETQVEFRLPPRGEPTDVR